MDYQQISQNNRRSQKMETAAMVLGTIAMASLCMVYPSLICGSLAIVFALLSRGGEMTFSSRAKIGLVLGCISLCIVVLMFVYTIIIANLYYGGIENMMRETYNSLGLDYDTLFRNLY